MDTAAPPESTSSPVKSTITSNAATAKMVSRPFSYDNVPQARAKRSKKNITFAAVCDNNDAPHHIYQIVFSGVLFFVVSIVKTKCTLPWHHDFSFLIPFYNRIILILNLTSLSLSFSHTLCLPFIAISRSINTSLCPLRILWERTDRGRVLLPPRWPKEFVPVRSCIMGT